MIKYIKPLVAVFIISLVLILHIPSDGSMSSIPVFLIIALSTFAVIVTIVLRDYLNFDSVKIFATSFIIFSIIQILLNPALAFYHLMDVLIVSIILAVISTFSLNKDDIYSNNINIQSRGILSFEQQIEIIKALARSKNLGFRSSKNKIIVYNKFIIIEYAPDFSQIQISELNSNPRVINIKIDSFYYFYDSDSAVIKLIESVIPKTDYDAVKRIVLGIFNLIFVHETVPKEYTINSPKKEIAKQNLVIDLNVKKTDINNASEQEIAALEGVSIIAAKKAVQYRDLKCGFKTLDEFFKVIKLKKFFISKIQTKLIIGEYKVKINNNLSEDRIVDL